MTLVDRQMEVPDLRDDEAVAVGAGAEGGGQAIVVNRIGPRVHQKRRTGDDTTHRIRHVPVLTHQIKRSYTHAVSGPHGSGMDPTRWARGRMRCQPRTRQSRRGRTSTGTARTSLRPTTDTDAIGLAIYHGTRINRGPRSRRIAILALA